MKLLLLWLVVGNFITGCTGSQSITDKIDTAAFKHVGGTFFTEPEIATMKEVHLDNGVLLGEVVIVEGAVSDISDNFTFLVLSDSTARMLIKLTEIDDAEPILTKYRPQILKVLGTVETGNKGRPIIVAKSLNIIHNIEEDHL